MHPPKSLDNYTAFEKKNAKDKSFLKESFTD
jgi:hypothetical protein